MLVVIIITDSELFLNARHCANHFVVYFIFSVQSYKAVLRLLSHFSEIETETLRGEVIHSRSRIRKWYSLVMIDTCSQHLIIFALPSSKRCVANLEMLIERSPLHNILSFSENITFSKWISK